MVGHSFHHRSVGRCHRRSSHLLILAIFFFCLYDIRIKGFTITKPTTSSSLNHQHHDATTTMYAIQDRLLDVLRLQWEDGKRSNNEDNQSSPAKDTKQSVPFIIQRIGRGNKQEIEEITKLCIGVFFNEQEGLDSKVNTPWKSLQLAYLGNLQRGDILARNAFNKDQLVDLIVARRIYSVDGSSNNKIEGKGASSVVGDNCQIFNAEQLPSSNGAETRLVVGEIIGYCEMTEKKFGLGGKFEDDAEEKSRPYLGNLSVAKYARSSGVGSALLDECESVVSDEWNAGHTEIVLQVEEDNTSAIQFYKRRGWEFAFADPTCRRFDTSGIFLKESRITKFAMVKRLQRRKGGQNGLSNGGDAAESVLDKLRNSFFVRK